MAEVATLARPYAEAVFNLARDRGALPVWSERLAELSALATHAEMRAAIGDPNLGAQQITDLLGSAVKTPLDDEARAFLRVLADNDRLKLLPEVCQQFEALRNEHEGVAEAHVLSAFPMSEGDIAELTGALERRFRRKLRALVEVDQSLIGGVRVQIGDEVLDASVRARLDAMATALQS